MNMEVRFHFCQEEVFQTTTKDWCWHHLSDHCNLFCSESFCTQTYGGENDPELHLKAQSFERYVGDTVMPADFLDSIEDDSAVVLSFLSEGNILYVSK